MKNFNIKSGYNHRDQYSYFDDMKNTDGWQKEVYQQARTIFKQQEMKSIADVGCGSAFKLLKYFPDDETYGFDVEPTLSKLKENHPTKTWKLSDFNKQPNHVDMVVCADVIEHVLNPDALLDYLKSFNAKQYLISTPDRDLVYGGQDNNGPPTNPTHIREWNYKEFYDYIGTHLKITHHWISNKAQFTQCVIATLK